MIARRKRNLHLGLLPRMEARVRKDGGYTFRYKAFNGCSISLGRDRHEAIRKVLEIEGRAPHAHMLSALIEDYMRSTSFQQLALNTQADYQNSKKEILKRFSKMDYNQIEPYHIARYLRIERAGSPVRANREIAFLSTVLQFGIECGRVRNNPCRQVRRNRETPRTRKVETEELRAVLEIAQRKGASYSLIGLIAEFCALTGQRREDVLSLYLSQITEQGIYIEPKKRKRGEAQTKILIAWSTHLRDIVVRAKALPRPVKSFFLFCNRKGQPYTDRGFKAMWNRLQVEHAQAGGKRFTFHDLRAYYVTEGKEAGIRVTEATGHKSEAITNRVYDRRRIRKATPLN